MSPVGGQDFQSWFGFARNDDTGVGKITMSKRCQATLHLRAVFPQACPDQEAFFTHHLSDFRIPFGHVSHFTQH